MNPAVFPDGGPNVADTLRFRAAVLELADPMTARLLSAAATLLDRPRVLSDCAVLAEIHDILVDCEREAQRNAAAAESLEAPGLAAASGMVDPSPSNLREIASCWRARAAEVRNVRERLVASFDVVLRQ